jgi:hypothetical protein
MPWKKALTVGLLTMPLFVLGLRSDASGGLFSRHCRDCDAQHETIRLPAQQIHVEVARPQVVVQQTAVASRLHHRGLVAMPATPFLAAPFVAQPIVASFYLPPQETRISTGSQALRAAHDLEAQALEVARLRAAHEVEVAHLNMVHQRIMANFSKTPAPVTGDLNQLKTEIEKLSQRISDIERLLIIHDNILNKKGKDGPND